MNPDARAPAPTPASAHAPGAVAAPGRRDAPPPDVYDSYAALVARHREGVDFERTLHSRPGSQVVILAPHGGRLENHTDTIAEQVAGADFSLYCFRSRLGWGQTNLHITSHRFDDPDCLALLARHRGAVALHGCAQDGERVFLGGRDRPLVDALADALGRAGLRAEVEGHAYPGQHPYNVCNRTASGRGVQIEMTLRFRRSEALPCFVATLRDLLLRWPQATATAAGAGAPPPVPGRAPAR